MWPWLALKINGNDFWTNTFLIAYLVFISKLISLTIHLYIILCITLLLSIRPEGFVFPVNIKTLAFLDDVADHIDSRLWVQGGRLWLHCCVDKVLILHKRSKQQTIILGAIACFQLLFLWFSVTAEGTLRFQDDNIMVYHIDPRLTSFNDGAGALILCTGIYCIVSTQESRVKPPEEKKTTKDKCFFIVR